MQIKINRKHIKVLAAIMGAVLAIVLIFALLSVWENRHDAAGSDAAEEGYMYLNDVCYMPNSSLETILMIGVDKYEGDTKESYNNNQQADFLMMLVLDRADRTYTGIHLNRDTVTDIPVLGVRGESAGTVTGQLALAHTYGSGGKDSCRNTVNAVSNLLYGVKINHYVSFTMNAVEQINDLAGGVTVTMLDDLSSVSPEMRKGATVTLKGEKALAYVRARYGLEDSSNLNRMKRQRQYLTELSSQISSKRESDDSFMLKALDRVAEYMVSDCTIDQLSRIYDYMETYEDGGFRAMEGKAAEGDEFMEFYPDEDALKQLVAEIFYVKAQK